MTTYQTSSSPDSSRAISPTVLLQYRQKDKGSYVQRWKVLRDRNRNLPKLDFNIKATVIPKRQQRNYGIGLTRSYTMDSGTKLPSISTSSVITTASTNVTGTSGHKPQSSGKKAVSIQDGVEVQAQDKHLEVNLNPAMSKSLPNIANASQQETTKSPKHRYEKIAHSKRLMKRSHDKESNNSKETQILEQSAC